MASPNPVITKGTRYEGTGVEIMTLFLEPDLVSVLDSRPASESRLGEVGRRRKEVCFVE